MQTLPNEGAYEAARRTLRDGSRASDVITRLRALYTNKESTPEPLDLNATTQEVIALSLSDLQMNRVIMKSELADGLPLVNGDRVQLQQVILRCKLARQLLSPACTKRIWYAMLLMRWDR